MVSLLVPYISDLPRQVVRDAVEREVAIPCVDGESVFVYREERRRQTQGFRQEQFKATALYLRTKWLYGIGARKLIV